MADSWVSNLLLLLNQSGQSPHASIGQIEARHPLCAGSRHGERSWELPLGHYGHPQITVTPYELMSLYVG
ncbi:MAG: hypothetical protein AB7P17_12695 [Nitrospirales bacterium]